MVEACWERRGKHSIAACDLQYIMNLKSKLVTTSHSLLSESICLNSHYPPRFYRYSLSPGNLIPIDDGLLRPIGHKPPDVHNTVHYNYSHQPNPHFAVPVLVDSNDVKAEDKSDQMIQQIVNSDLMVVEVVDYSRMRIDDGCYYAWEELGE
jgi:hypothetical protein